MITMSALPIIQVCLLAAGLLKQEMDVLLLSVSLSSLGAHPSAASRLCETLPPIRI